MGDPSFQNIPDNVLVPGFYVEFQSLDDAVPLDDVEPALMFAPKTAAGTADADVPVRVVTADHGQGLLGRGSAGDRMVKAFRNQNLLKELWVIPVADDGAAVKPIWTFYVPTAPTEAGSVVFYVGGQRLQVPVSSADTHQDVAESIVDAFEDAPDLVVEYVTSSLDVRSLSPFTTTHASALFNYTAHGLVAGTRVRFVAGTGTLPGGIVEGVDHWVLTSGHTSDAFKVTTDSTLGPGGTGTAITFGSDVSGAVTVEVVPKFTVHGKHGGTILNGLDIQLNYKDSAAGEVLPAGLSLEWSRTTDGATDPSLTAALAALSDDPYDHVATPWTSALDDLKTEMEARWAWNKLIFGHVWAVKDDTSTNVITYGGTRNGKDETVFGVKGYPTPDFEVLGAVLGQMSLTLDADPALPEQTLVLSGVLPPKRGNAGRWDMETRQAVLEAGVATLAIGRGLQVSIERSRNTYKTDDVGDSDKTYRDIQSRFIPMRSTRYLGRVVRTKFRRKKIVPDDQVLPADGSTTKPSVIKQEFQAAYSALVEVGWLTNVGLFKERATVGQDASDPSRVNVFFPNELVKQVRVVALANAFR